MRKIKQLHKKDLFLSICHGTLILIGFLIPNSDRAANLISRKNPTNQEIREEMCKLFTNDFPEIGYLGCSIRNNLTYTWEVIKLLKDNLHCDLYVIFSSDWLGKGLEKREYIEKNATIVIPTRPGYATGTVNLNIEIGISSSIVRKRVQDGLTIRGLTSESVCDVIRLHNLYRKRDD